MDAVRARTWAAPTYAIAMFASAALIFVLQPMFARMTTPLLGGSPAVWNTSMVFFQAALLLGYAYAHVLARVEGLARQVLIHALVLLIGVIVLPVRVSGLLGDPNTALPSVWLFGVLALSVGLPYAALSATAPVMQSWYARTGREDAGDPYYLYAASNLGSLLGLAAYPLALEPALGLSTQSIAWSGAYGVVGLAILASGWLAMRSKGEAQAQTVTSAAARPAWKDRLYWMAAAAVPSSLLLAVTSHISTDVASAPFLWVAPLGLYLITFVIAFGKNADIFREPASIITPLALAGLIIAFSESDIEWVLAAHLGCFFFCALTCHLSLSAARPSATHLTEFYMWVSVGGVLGGAVTALIAPLVFNDVYEYPLALAAAALFLPRTNEKLPVWMIAIVGALILFALYTRFDDSLNAAFSNAPRLWLVDEFGAVRDVWKVGLAVAAGWGLALGANWLHRAGLLLALTTGVLLAVITYGFAQGSEVPIERHEIGLSVAAAALFANRNARVLAGLMVLCAFLMVKIYAISGNERNSVFQDRSFFGVTRVYEEDRGFGPVRIMLHGTTIHGAQYVSGDRVREPLTYYSQLTGLGMATKAAVERFPEAHIGLIGLGSGSTACHARRQDALTIFEIDPMVVRFATRDGVFTYVPQCKPDAKVVLGDGRLGVQKLADGALDVLVVDAFSSDAVPAHLLTVEALRIYMQKLSPNGFAILHLSNRNLDLVAEASRVVQASGFVGRNYVASAPSAEDHWSVFDTSVIVVARDQATLDALGLQEGWDGVAAKPGRAWSDEYINLIRPLTPTLRRAFANKSD
jgi:hypothetical protein